MCVVVWGHKFQIWAGPGSAHYSLTNAKPLRFGVFPCDTRSRDLCLHISIQPFRLHSEGRSISEFKVLLQYLIPIQSIDLYVRYNRLMRKMKENFES